MPLSAIMTVIEVADYLQVHRSTVYRLLKEGKLPGFLVGADWRFSREAIEEWIASRTLEALEHSRVSPLERARIRAVRSGST